MPCRIVLLLAAVLNLRADAVWQRHVLTEKGERTDHAKPHTLAYFTRYPMLREETDPFCYLCTPEKRLSEAKKYKVRTELRYIGTIHGFAIYDLFYRFNNPSDPDWKTILVKSGPNEFREIYHCEPTQVDARAVRSSIVIVSREGVLSTRYWHGGNSGGHTDDYYWFDETGPHPLDLTPAIAAAQSALPKGYEIWASGDGRFLDSSSKLRWWVQTKRDSRCCDGGEVEVHFKLDHGRVVVTRTRYDPEGGPFHPSSSRARTK
jgi:hypothetical protein